ncbi:hypothetical protein JTB14_035064 [Gonioctena quinquepunctata]|nr:hypothetical protein JTB14_035064 [Gonioctena quinquepunctata]
MPNSPTIMSLLAPITEHEAPESNRPDKYFPKTSTVRSSLPFQHTYLWAGPNRKLFLSATIAELIFPKGTPNRSMSCFAAPITDYRITRILIRNVLR